MESDFSENGSNDQPLSQDDKKLILNMERGIRQREDGHYEMPPPFREEKAPNAQQQNRVIKPINQTQNCCVHERPY